MFPKSLFHRLRGCEAGTAAVEFSLFMPVLIFGCLMTVDLGMAIHERMSVDAALRAGAQVAIADPGEEAVVNVVNTTASRNFSLAGDQEEAPSYTGSNGQAFSVSVNRYCGCPDSPGSEVSCTATCAGEVQPYLFYEIGGTKTYSAILIPDVTHDSSIKVQVK